jgi:heterodisulfide reductase subunit A-like polyferredoxin
MIEEDGKVAEPIHDLVVLSVGLQPGDDPRRFVGVDLDQYGFVASPEPKLDATLTTLPGVVAAGTALGPKDIVDSIAEASAAATRVAVYLGPPAMAPHPPDDGLEVEVRDINAGDAVAVARPEVQRA